MDTTTLKKAHNYIREKITEINVDSPGGSFISWTIIKIRDLKKAKNMEFENSLNPQNFSHFARTADFVSDLLPFNLSYF